MIPKSQPGKGDAAVSPTDSTVVVGVDGTASGLAALTEAARDAADTHAHIVCVHVRAEPAFAEMMVMMAPYATTVLSEWRDALELDAWLNCLQVLEVRGLDWDFEVASGRPAECLGEAAAARHASAVYVGARERCGLARWFHRCPALELARSCRCPVRLINHSAPTA
jgi:nucleotide-binding universal stress UspA family protein